MWRRRMVILLLLTGCSKGPDADFNISARRVRSARSGRSSMSNLAEEAYRHLHRYDAQELRDQLQTASKALSAPDFAYGVEIEALLSEPDDATPGELRAHVDRLKQIKDSLDSVELTLGIMTAVGGFVDISEFVFAAQAGSSFGYALIWCSLSTIGMMVFGEMSGRVAAVAKQPYST